MSVGSYAYSSGDFTDWLSSSTETSTVTSRRSSSKNKKIVYPLFLELMEYTDDPFWKDKFEKAASGKLPRSFTYNDGVLTFHKGNKVNNIERNKSLRNTCKHYISFFNVYGSIFSPTERNTSSKKYSDHCEEEEEEAYTWKKLGAKNQFCIMVDYVELMSKRMELNRKAKNNLYYTLDIGLKLKYLGENNVTLHGNQIIKIEGLIYDEDNNQFEIEQEYKNANVKKSQAKESTAKNKNTILNIWKKQMEMIEKKIMSNKKKEVEEEESESEEEIEEEEEDETQ